MYSLFFPKFGIGRMSHFLFLYIALVKKLIQADVDKPTCLSFSFSLDLLLISIKQT